MDKKVRPLNLPILQGRSFTKAEIELLREMDPAIEVLPDGSFTINGETPAEINAKYDKTIKQLLTTDLGPKSQKER